MTVGVPIQVNGSAVTSPSRKSPARCTAVLKALTAVNGNVEPDPSNNSTDLVIDINDHEDF